MKSIKLINIGLSSEKTVKLLVDGYINIIALMTINLH